MVAVFLAYKRFMIFRKITITVYVALVLVMAVATMVTTMKGQAYAVATIYSSAWFCALWGLLAVGGVAWISQRRGMRPSVLLLHGALLLILAGALVTHLTAQRGSIHLRKGEPTVGWQRTLDNGQVVQEALPFSLKLEGFEVMYDVGTQTEANYRSTLWISDGQHSERASISMNHVLRHRGIWFYQSAYDDDMQGSTLSINADPYGIAITYTAYALLALALLWMLADPNGGFARLLRDDRLRRSVIVMALLVTMSAHADAAPTLPRHTASAMGRLCMLYNGRICTLQTYAKDFTRKIYGKDSYQGLSAEQVLTGWIFWGDEWSREQFIHIKEGPLMEHLRLADYVSLSAFFDNQTGRYLLGPYISQFYNGNQSKLYQQAAETDERLQLIMDLRHGRSLRLFPVGTGGRLQWVSPVEKLPKGLAQPDSMYIRGVFEVLYQYALEGNYAGIEMVASKMGLYQQKHGAASMPSVTQQEAEHLYNHLDTTRWLFMACLSLGMLMMVVIVVQMIRGGRLGRIFTACHVLGGAAWLVLTAHIALRWIISGTIPMANGYETMLLLAWIIMLITLAAACRWRIMLPQGLLLGGFLLLVSHIGEMDPNITPTMPVLRSPLLSLHVSVIMLAYALLSITFLCSATALVVRRCSAEPLMLLAHLMLYPALVALSAGIFIGAVWANVSWGSYWNWDPKEVWALITLMVYAVPLHNGLLKRMNRPTTFHIYMVAAFGVLIMTYFGVNYLMTGMHSYY